MGVGGDAQSVRQSRANDDATKLRLISKTELDAHQDHENAWIVVNNKVYDISGWKGHPGGQVVFTHAGRDASEAFAAFHPRSAYETLDQFEIGRYKDDEKTQPSKETFESELRTLRMLFKKMGYFTPNPLYYMWKTASTIALVVFAWWLLVASEGKSYPLIFASAVSLAFFWQQCGWLAHDFLHHQVFRNRLINDLIGGITFGNFFQGFSLEWWKNKHNTHHAIPNAHETADDKHDGDPDIDTMPLLAWSQKMANKAKDMPVAQFFIKYQNILYFPILFIARLSWAQQSLAFAFQWQTGWTGAGTGSKLRYPKLEPLGLICHYAVLFYMIGSNLSFFQGVSYFIAAQCFCGLLLAVAFGVGHNGMAVFDKETSPSFSQQQILSTRNVDDDVLGFTGWFMGGLHYQVEHHLFPMIPRHHLPAVRRYVEPLCAKYGVKYHSTNMIDGNVEVLDFLKAISDEAQHFPAM